MDTPPKKRIIRRKKDAPTNELIVQETPEKEDPCPICISPYTTLVRKKITCSYCSESACMACVKRYIVSSIDDPHCMHCRKGWTMSFLYDNLTRAYMMNEYADHRAAILWSRQESLLPAEQVSVERIIRGRQMRTTEEYKNITFEYAQAQRRLNELTEVLNKKNSDITRLLMGQPTAEEVRAAGGTVELEKKVRAEAREFIRRCPHTDCNGFLSSAWKCGICSNYTCNECLEVKGRDRDADHTCNADALATAKLLAKDTKPCPKCGVYINKSVGCDLMWCTACQTPFSWSTLKISEARNIHNPHYFEFLQRTNGAVPRAPGDMICGGIPDAHTIVYSIKYPEYKRYISNVIRGLRHTQDIELRRYHGEMTLNEQEMRQMRINFLLKDETKESICNKLQLYERQRERAYAIHAILETLVTAGGDIIRNLAGQITGKTNIEILAILKQTFGQLEELHAYINEQLAKISWLHNVNAPHITNVWDVTKQKYKKDYTSPPIQNLTRNLTDELTIINDYVKTIGASKDADERIKMITEFCNEVLTIKHAGINKDKPELIAILLDELDKDSMHEFVQSVRRHLVRLRSNTEIQIMNIKLGEKKLHAFPLKDIPVAPTP